MKLSTFFLLLLLLSCKPSSNKLELPTSKEEELLPTYNSGTKIYESSLLDSVVKEYLLYLDIDTSHLHSISNNTIETNYIALKEESFEARLYTDSEGSFIAINHAEDKDNCTWHKAFLLRKNEKNIWEDQFDSFYPNLSLYSFYTFEDEETKQFEGDEETVFAGYHFDLSSSESLGIQFMFCNLRDQGNTQSLNLNAHRIYKDIHE
ncbi:MAG: hypothetical protein H6579_08705 [Chitinophagales bacterium]|nr:hypothetical protein [Bacteroidota bacterium]MCB9257195.1 hypothetical protein [Chitinophagales bacterium]